MRFGRRGPRNVTLSSNCVRPKSPSLSVMASFFPDWRRPGDGVLPSSCRADGVADISCEEPRRCKAPTLASSCFFSCYPARRKLFSRRCRDRHLLQAVTSGKFVRVHLFRVHAQLLHCGLCPVPPWGLRNPTCNYRPSCAPDDRPVALRSAPTPRSAPSSTLAAPPANSFHLDRRRGAATRRLAPPMGWMAGSAASGGPRLPERRSVEAVPALLSWRSCGCVVSSKLEVSRLLAGRPSLTRGGGRRSCPNSGG